MIPRHNRVAVIESLPGSPVTSEGETIITRRVRGPLDGPLLPYGPGFEAAPTDQGYSADSIGRHLRLMVHLSRWLAEQHLALPFNLPDLFGHGGSRLPGVSL